MKPTEWFLLLNLKSFQEFAEAELMKSRFSNNGKQKSIFENVLLAMDLLDQNPINLCLSLKSAELTTIMKQLTFNSYVLCIDLSLQHKLFHIK